MKYKTLVANYPIISDQVTKRELEIILTNLEIQLADSISGEVVEFGCYVGTTSLFIRRLLDAYHSERVFHVYDSFEGLPEKTSKDMSPVGEQFRAGELSTSKKDYILTFKKAGLRPPYIHKGWFGELEQSSIPEQIAFAFLDGDYYESIMTPLELIWPKLASGAVVIVDDYANEALPGASCAVDEWVRTHRVVMQIESSLAILKV